MVTTLAVAGGATAGGAALHAQTSKLHRNLNLCSQWVRLPQLDMAAEFTGFAAFTLRSCAAESPALRAVW